MDDMKTTADLGPVNVGDWTRIQENSSDDDTPPVAPGPEPETKRGESNLLLRIAVVLSLVALVAGSHVVLLTKIRTLEADALKRSVVAQGLGLESSTDGDVARVLSNLKAVSIDSDTWHTSIEDKGMEPEEFLGRLLQFAERSEEAYRVAGYSEKLVRLANREADLLALAKRKSALTDLANKTEPLMSLAEAWPKVAGLAGHSETLGQVAENAPSIQSVASLESALARLAPGAEGLSRLADVSPALVEFAQAHLATTQQLAAHSALILDLVERRGGSLDRLSESEAVILALAAQQQTLSRLAHQHAPLLEYARAEQLPRLDRVAPQLEVLAAHSEELLGLIDENAAPAVEGG